MSNHNFISLNNHPLVEHKLTILRDKTTNNYVFRNTLHQLTNIVAAEALKFVKCKKNTIKTPMNQNVEGKQLPFILLVPIIRAGLAMMDPLQNLLDNTLTGFIGAARNEKTLEISSYYENIPEIEDNSVIFVLDPMLATGNTIVSSINTLKKKITAKNVQYFVLGILSVDNAVKNITKHHSDITIVSAFHDEKLNSEGYIIPGLGDAGDRLYSINKIND